MLRLLTRLFYKGAIAVLCLGFLVACKEKAKITKIQQSLVVSEIKNTEKHYFTGEIKPLRETAISVAVDAKVKALNFSFGSFVKKDEILMTLDSPVQQKEYDEALTSYLKSKDDLDIAKAKFSGTQSLWDEKLVSENMYKSDKSTLLTNKISFFQAKAKLVEMAKKLKSISTKEMLALSLNDFDRVQTVLNKSKNVIIIKAPHEGIVLLPPKNEESNPLRVGSLIKGGDVVALIGDLSGLSITIKIQEVNIGKIKEGMQAEITGVGFPDLVLKAFVQSINAQANTATGSTGGLPIFTAKVVVASLTKAQQSILKVGMSASVNVLLKEESKIMIPIKALIQEGGNTWVMLETKQGLKQKIEVKTGVSTNNTVHIIQGLKQGDRIVWTE